MHIKFLLLVAFIWLCICQEVQAQKYLLLHKANSKRRYQIYPGEVIRYKLKDQDNYLEDIIRDFDVEKNLIIFDIGAINVNNIAAVDIRPYEKKPGISISRWGTWFIAGGVAYVVITGFNGLRRAGNEIVINESVWIISGSLVAIGVFLKLMKKKKFKPKGNRLIEIVEI
ncbi:hypothetical protein [Xanthovirga aplysinae]|uniref:hypothetical protein n=1 Tax=Xanthovirga aplysinae TaxID=2529853 RepID=UPI0012BB6EB1|nr:hypothetical protein [Xanthovirga aplysinae]MTI33124.1 hypothetical protein [Xanthovirga aplysinae]